jgi:hypothetical protein
VLYCDFFYLYITRGKQNQWLLTSHIIILLFLLLTLFFF